MTILRTQAQVQDAGMPDLVETYNAMCEHLGKKPVKRFESVEVGRARVVQALLAAQDADGHSGVPKNSTPKPLTSDELAAKTGKRPAAPAAEEPAAAPAATEGTLSPTPDQKEPIVATKTSSPTKSKPAAKKAPAAPAKKGGKPAAKKASAQPAAKKAPAPRGSTYDWVKLGQPSIPRRPQEGSVRTQVLNQLRTHVDPKGKGVPVSLEQLSKECGFDVRPYVHKLVAVEWAEVCSAPKDAQK